jgi:hypothetical protein
MANAGAFTLGWNTASDAIARRRDRKEQLADEERRLKVADLYGKGHELSATIAALKPDDPERSKMLRSLEGIEADIASVYHPIKNPGVMERDWNFLRDMITRKPRVSVNPSYSPTTSPSTTFTPQPETVRLAADGDSPAQAITLPSGTIEIPGYSYDIRPAPEAMSKQQRQFMAQMDEARKQAQLDVQAGGLTPEQAAQQQSRTNLANITQAMKDFKTMRPNASPQEESEFFTGLIGKSYGVAQKPVYKEFIDPNGVKRWLDVTQPVEPGWTATGSETADTRTREDFGEFKKQHPEYQGTFEQWKTEQSQRGKIAVPTNRDDRYIDIERRRQLGQPLSAEDEAYAAAWDLYVNKRVIAPGVARAAAFAADRFVQVVDPQDPEKVIFMPAGQAARAGAGTPASIGFKTDAAITKYMTSGKGGENIAYFSTAASHLQLLGEAADALNNGDIQRLNQLGNRITQEIGGPAPTNFEAVKSAVSGELAKTFTGKGATVEEIAQINGVINSAESPDQLAGVIRYYSGLMGGKLNALRSQYEAGKSGRPAFPSNTPPAHGAAGGAAAAGGKGSRSIGAAMAYWRGHPQQAEKSFNTANPSEQQVIEDIQSKGYAPTRP